MVVMYQPTTHVCREPGVRLSANNPFVERIFVMRALPRVNRTLPSASGTLGKACDSCSDDVIWNRLCISFFFFFFSFFFFFFFLSNLFFGRLCGRPYPSTSTKGTRSLNTDIFVHQHLAVV
jgi:hypothetical protein